MNLANRRRRAAGRHVLSHQLRGYCTRPSMPRTRRPGSAASLRVRQQARATPRSVSRRSSASSEARQSRGRRCSSRTRSPSFRFGKKLYGTSSCPSTAVITPRGRLPSVASGHCEQRDTPVTEEMKRNGVALGRSSATLEKSVPNEMRSTLRRRV